MIEGITGAGPLAFLAVGHERLEDVIACAKAWGLRLLASELELNGPTKVLEERIFVAKELPSRQRPRVEVGLAWRALRAWRRAQEQIQRARDDEEVGVASGEHLRAIASLNSVPVSWPPEDDETLRAKVRAARAGRAGS